MPENILAVVMAGGMGGRLRPLSDVRAKPAVPFGGVYRIIDFTLSNCVNSNIRRIVVLTQYKSHSLSNHIKLGWNFLSRRLDQYVDEIPAQMQLGDHWYSGTADAIRQNMSFIEECAARLVLIVPGDHVYKMDYRLLRRYHDEWGARLTIPVARVKVSEARGTYGVVDVDDQSRIVRFTEKPDNPTPIPGTDECYVSMGIYMFGFETLHEVLAGPGNDFGSEIVPALVAAGEPVYAYDFARLNRIEDYEFHMHEGVRHKALVPRTSDSDYWRDVGTIDAYWAANLELVSVSPRFNLYGQKWPIFNCPQHFPPAKFVHEAGDRVGMATNSIVADGTIISGARVRNSVLSAGVYMHSHALVENSVLLGGSIVGGVTHETTIGRHSRVRNAILDKNVNLREGTIIGYDRNEDERRGLKTTTIPGGSDWVTVVPKDRSM